jgi:hypothetical protein
MNNFFKAGLGKLRSRIKTGEVPVGSIKEIAESLIGEGVNLIKGRLPENNQLREGLPSGAQVVDAVEGVGKRILLDKDRTSARKKKIKS